MFPAAVESVLIATMEPSGGYTMISTEAVDLAIDLRWLIGVLLVWLLICAGC